MRIDSEHISFTDDGHAWWVVLKADVVRDSVFSSKAFVSDLDRPCDACDGSGWRDRQAKHGALCGCHGGRHTFEIETDCDRCGRGGMVQIGNYPDQSARTIQCDCAYWTEGHRSLTRTVSVVPGTILPIVPSTPCEHGPIHLVRLFPDDPTWAMCPEGPSGITLPPVAKPGDWAVQLKVAK